MKAKGGRRKDAFAAELTGVGDWPRARQSPSGIDRSLKFGVVDRCSVLSNLDGPIEPERC